MWRWRQSVLGGLHFRVATCQACSLSRQRWRFTGAVEGSWNALARDLETDLVRNVLRAHEIF